MKNNDVIKNAVKMITDAGYRPRVVRGKHYKIKWKQNEKLQTFVCPVSPSDWRAIHRSRSVLRRLLNGK
jgi:hypothetical protein